MNSRLSLREILETILILPDRRQNYHILPGIIHDAVLVEMMFPYYGDGVGALKRKQKRFQFIGFRPLNRNQSAVRGAKQRS